MRIIIETDSSSQPTIQASPVEGNINSQANSAAAQNAGEAKATSARSDAANVSETGQPSSNINPFDGSKAIAAGPAPSLEGKG